MTTIKFKLLHPDAKLPVRATEHAAAFDVVAVSRTIKDGYVDYGLGFATEIPAGWEGKFYARSSICASDLVLCNGVGVIDCDYRGEWRARFKASVNLDDPAPSGDIYHQQRDYLRYFYQVGERIGQIQFQRVPEVHLVLADDLTITTRGAGGFGSTGA